MSPNTVLAPLPKFLSIDQIKELLTEQSHTKKININVIGFVVDYQKPIPTKGTHYKCSIEIRDYSNQHAKYGLKVNFFLEEQLMPKISDIPGDAVLIRSAMPQMFQGTPSLLVNKFSQFHVLASSYLLRGASSIPNISHWTPSKEEKPSWRKPTVEETNYVLKASQEILKTALPPADDFKEKATRSVNVRDKFCLLKDIKPDGYYDIIGEVIRVFDGSSGPVTIYLSDYTAHSLFYNYIWKNDAGPQGNEYGYITSKSKKSEEWPGPYGKLTIQLTCFDGNAYFAREQVKEGQWLMMKNVNIKTAREGNLLEGKLRGDRNGNEEKHQIEIMQRSDDTANNDPRWKDAIGRKLKYLERFKKQKQAKLAEDAAAESGGKRKRDEEPVKLSSKQRRKEKRAAAQQKEVIVKAKASEIFDLNTNLKCSHLDHPISTLQQILAPQTYSLDSESNVDIILPFINANYKANVRIIGYFPNRIEDFAVSRRVTDFDMLSDYSADADMDEETDADEYERFSVSREQSEKIWEWRFALEVKDACSKDSEDCIWLYVDNHAGQALLNLDAADLRTNSDLLSEVKEKLCILWGDLEEKKSALLPHDATTNEASFEPNSSQFLKSGQLPIDSDDEESDFPRRRLTIPAREVVAQERDANNNTNEGDTMDPYHPPVRNKAFTCCIKQYGVKETEVDPRKADAGEGKRWERKFGMFGVTIA